MKQAIISILVFICMFAATSCKDTLREEPPMENVTQVLRSADSAKADIAYFDTLSAALVAHSEDSGAVNYNNAPIKAFTVRAIDLLAAMGMPQGEAPTLPYDHVRVYLGFNKAAGQFKLYIVPVEQASLDNHQPGRDLVLNNQGVAVQPPPHYDPAFLQDKYVLDLNAPCPNLCDVQTPLISNNNQ